MLDAVCGTVSPHKHKQSPTEIFRHFSLFSLLVYVCGHFGLAIAVNDFLHILALKQPGYIIYQFNNELVATSELPLFWVI